MLTRRSAVLLATVAGLVACSATAPRSAQLQIRAAAFWEAMTYVGGADGSMSDEQFHKGGGDATLAAPAGACAIVNFDNVTALAFGATQDSISFRLVQGNAATAWIAVPQSTNGASACAGQ